MKKSVKAVYEKGVLIPLEDLKLRNGEMVTILLQEDIVQMAKRVRALVRTNREPSEILSEERERLRL